MSDIERLRERRRRAATRRRRLRLATWVVAAALIVAAFVFAYLVVVPRLLGEGGSGAAETGAPAASESPTPPARPSPTTSPSPSATPSASPSPTRSAADEVDADAAPAKPAIVDDPIPFGEQRRQQMAAYSKRHYGEATVVLRPRLVALHYTAGGTYQSARNHFAANTPNVGELPGVVTHFVIDKDGTIYQLIPLDLRGRHVIGLNHVAIGIEFVQEAGSGDSWATAQIMGRPAQLKAGLRLVRWLCWRFDIPPSGVIGHGTANDSRFFKDLQGWTNTHVDWGPAPVRRFREKLADFHD